jgi:molybdopterin molybdotransferase
MDGYAVRDLDLQRLPASLIIVGESFAGGQFPGPVRSGECVRIFTGAAVPDGSDRVVMQENVSREGDIATFEASPGAARHIRKAGGDFRVGDSLLDAGRMLDARAIVAAAGADLSEIEVIKKPRIYIVGTGDELVEPGTAASTNFKIPESVSFGIAAMAEQWGGEVTARKRVRDDVTELEQAATEAVRRADLVVVTGGASVGERDFAKAMFGPMSLDLIFAKVSIKPGKPVWLGSVGTTLVMGLPGNPTSALVTGRLLLAPLLAGMTGWKIEEALDWRRASLAAALPECGAREIFHRARWAGDAVEILTNQDSSAQKALALADVLVRQRANAPELSAGSLIDVLDF